MVTFSLVVLPANCYDIYRLQAQIGIWSCTVVSHNLVVTASVAAFNVPPTRMLKPFRSRNIIVASSSETKAADYSRLRNTQLSSSRPQLPRSDRQALAYVHYLILRVAHEGRAWDSFLSHLGRNGATLMSTTRSACVPSTRQSLSTHALGSVGFPILVVPHICHMLVALFLINSRIFPRWYPLIQLRVELDLLPETAVSRDCRSHEYHRPRPDVRTHETGTWDRKQEDR